MWISKTASYSFFVGGILSAEYNPESEIVLILSDKPGDTTRCTLKIKGKLSSNQDAQKKSCTQLAITLKNYLLK